MSKYIFRNTKNIYCYNKTLLIVPLECKLVVFSADFQIYLWCYFVVYKHFIVRSVLPKSLVQDNCFFLKTR